MEKDLGGPSKDLKPDKERKSDFGSDAQKISWLGVFCKGKAL